MERQTQSIRSLAEGCLNISRIEQGKILLRKQRLDLAQVVVQAVENARAAIDLGGHQLEVILPAEPLDFDGDPARLVQALTNLLNNASKYMDPGGASG